MYWFSIKIAAILTLLCAIGFAHKAPQQKNTDSKQSINRALEYVMEKGDAWIREKKCVSCHMVPFMIWSLNAAEDSGFKLPKEKLKYWRQWSLDNAGGDPSATGSEGLAAMINAKSKNERTTDEKVHYSRFARIIIGNQRNDGWWRPAGQMPDQKRTLRETAQIIGMWTMLALDDAIGSNAKDAIAKAKSTLSVVSERKSNEWAVARLLVAYRFGEKQTAEEQIEALRKTQNKDGGWGWLIGEKSDAYATGQTLYALSFLPKPKSSKMIEGGRAFLLRTQVADGSWEVNSTLEEKKNTPIATSNFWGTTWAIIGLCKSGVR